MNLKFSLRKASIITILLAGFVPFTAFGADGGHLDSKHVPDTIVNGDFQYPSNETIVSVNQKMTFGNSYNISPDAGTTNTKVDWAGDTVKIPGFDQSKFGWKSTQSLTEPGVIEIQHREKTNQSNLYVELCAFEANTAIYQDVKTIDDSIYRWELKHSAIDSRHVDKMKVLIGPAGKETVSPATRIESASGQEVGETSDVITSINKNIGYTVPPMWNTYTGAVYIPKGQTVTRFTFESVSSLTPTNGNLLDDVSFSIAYPLYYDLNGGVGTVPLPSDNDYSGYHACDDYVNLAIDNVPSKDGCVFVGWSTERLDTIHNQAEYDKVKDKIVTDVVFGDESMTVYAVYETTPFNVTFVDGLTGKVIYKQKVLKNGNASIPEIPTHDGYIPNGWDSDGINITHDTTITVNYMPIAYEIAFDKNSDDANGEMQTQKMTFDVSSPLRANQFVRKGYSFVGWSERKDGTGQAYTDRENVINLVSKNNGKITLYAQWMKNNSISIIYNVRSDDNLGENSVSNSIDIMNDNGDSPDGSTAIPDEGYEFVCWYNESGNVVSNDKKITPDRPSKNTVYTAYFKRCVLDVRFIDSDGTVLKEEKVKYGDSAVAPDNPYHDGYEFISWDKEFSNITQDTDIYATYKKKNHQSGNSNTNQNDNGNMNGNSENNQNTNLSDNLARNETNKDNSNSSNNVNNNDGNDNITDLIQTGIYGRTILIVMVISLFVILYCRYKKRDK